MCKHGVLVAYEHKNAFTQSCLLSLLTSLLYVYIPLWDYFDNNMYMYLFAFSTLSLVGSQVELNGIGTLD